MDFDQLETFLEVARHVSFSRAAEKRFRTQPAISSQIRALEEEVGAKLFDRSGGKVCLTAAGKAFQKYAEETLEARKAMLVTLAEMERVPRGEIVVGANEGTCLHILPEVFAGFKKLYPDVSVNIKRSDYAKILESVIDNSVDFGVVSLPVTDNRLTSVLIHRDELVLIAPPQHPLSKLKSVTVAEIAKFPLVVPKLGHTRDGIEQLFQERRLKLVCQGHFGLTDGAKDLRKHLIAACSFGFVERPIRRLYECLRIGLLFRKNTENAQAQGYVFMDRGESMGYHQILHLYPDRFRDMDGACGIRIREKNDKFLPAETRGQIARPI